MARTIIAVVLSPAILFVLLPLYAFAGIFMSELGPGERLAIATTVTPVGVAVAYGITIVGALPLHLLLRRLDWNRWWHYIAVGLLLGVGPFLIAASKEPDRLSLQSLAFGAFCAVPVSLVFWFIAARGDSPTA